MAELELTIYARNRAQAEYLVRSRAEQRGVAVSQIAVTAVDAEAWFVTVTVDDLAKAQTAHLDEDTQVLHFAHPSRR